ncbi:MAG: T9SS type A sorting domain-containing protein [Bacteroidota bacterium]
MLDFEDIDEDGDTTEEFLLDSLILPDRSIFKSYKYSFKNGSDYVFAGKKNAMIKFTYWSVVFGDTVLVKIVEYLELFIIEQIAEKFGIVSMRQESPDRFLTGAIINGKKYGTIVSVDEDLSELPLNYKLFPNYPNPFNNSTKITYQIPSLTKAKLIITDILGRTIKLLIDEEKTAGVYQVNFTAENLSSGIYFCSLITSNNIQTIKMIYLK